MHIDRKNLALNRYLLGTAALFSLAVAEGNARAADPAAKAVAEEFAQAIANGINAEPLAEGFKRDPVSGAHVLNAGYYKLVVEKTGGAQNDAEVAGRCNEILAKALGSQKLLSLVTARNDEVGVNLTLSLRPQAAAGENSEAEINLFRLFRRDGGKCRLQQSYFALKPEARYESPLIPLDPIPGADNIVEVKFQPWMIRTDDPSRISALWRGVGAFAKLLGPVGAIATSLFEEEDPYSVRAQAKASFFNVGIVPGSDIVQADSKREIVEKLHVAPRQGGALDRNWVVAKWDFINSNGQSPAHSLTYTVSVGYLGTRLSDDGTFLKWGGASTGWDGASAEWQRDLAGALLAKRLLPGGPRVDQLTPSIENLLKQRSVEGFSAACAPVFDDLEAMNFSYPDRSLLVYAVGVKHGFYPAQFNGIGCFQNEEVLASLARFKIAIPKPPIVVPDSKRLETLAAVQQAFNKPANVGAAKGRLLATLVTGAVGVAGDTRRMTTDGASFNGDSLKPADFFSRFNKLHQYEAACPLADWGATFMPNIAGGLTTTEKPVAFLARRQATGAIFLVIAGLSSKTNSLGQPELASLWVGEGGQQDDSDVRAIKRLMAQGECKDNPAFAPFFAPPPAAPVPEPSADLTPAGAAPVLAPPASGGTAPGAL